MANSLTSKVEIGGPMASLYLLGNPDHYSSHSFVPLYWRQYVMHVRHAWEVEADSGKNRAVPQSSPKAHTSFELPGSNGNDDSNESPPSDAYDKVVVSRNSGRYIGRSHLDDDKLRPLELDGVCVYEWVQCAVRKAKKDMKGQGNNLFEYAPGHPLKETHSVVFDRKHMRTVVPNFLGGFLPRTDGEDRELYCCTMLALFAPWRTGLELREVQQSWEEAFNASEFTGRLQKVILNLNIRYECYDARDDFHAQLQQRIAAQQEDGVNPDGDHEEDVDLEDTTGVEGELNEHDLCDESMLGTWSKRRLEQMKDVESALQSAGWVVEPERFTKIGAEGVPFCPEQSLAASKWKEMVAKERSKVIAARGLGSVNSMTIEDNMDIDFSANNDARVIPGAYLLSDFKMNDADVKAHLRAVITTCSLNTEQERAFRIIAHHSLSADPEPLQMYIGGMGGTGKTTVINALRTWFRKRGECGRMIVLAPTGAAASIIGGSTYHSYLGVRTGENKSTGTANDRKLDDARKRLAGVCYIFLDEISMVSCQDFHLIDLRLKELTKVHDLPFGGVSMIVAGDFAQLPPAKGQSLYSGQVSKVQLARQVQQDQENTLGMLLWHQFVTVVVLKKNMRQVADSSEDAKLRLALEHMRFKECTEDDLAFLKSRIPFYNKELSLNRGRWKDVSVITALNTHKDQINAMNAVRFAQEHGKTLHHFYSIDKESRELSSGRRKTGIAAISKPIRLTRLVQDVLWTCHPYTSQHIAACLSLCIDMPVMIRHNEATELCMTKGQEAIVKGWISREIPSFPGRRCLDVLFVELVKPPQLVKLPYLPQNIVPITKLSSTIRAILPNDRAVSITRQQIPVLLNFAMTDYASQGKTRDINVVDVKHCRNHQAIYTSLSRGRSARDTVILQDFKENKLKGGLSGYMRHEFRSLDTLDEVTRLQYQGLLPPGIVRNLRDSTIRSYRAYQAMKQGTESIPAVPSKRGIDDATMPAGKRRRLTAFTLRMNAVSQDQSTWLTSWIWDSDNWSCAYDSYFTILRFIWTTDRRFWTEVLTGLGVYTAKLAQGFKQVETSQWTLDAVRNAVRDDLWTVDDVSFPKGQTGTDIYGLVQHVCGLWTRTNEHSTLAMLECHSCGFRCAGSAFHSIGVYTVMRHVHDAVFTLGEYLQRLEKDSGTCSTCGSNIQYQNEYPPLINIQLPLLSVDVAGERMIIDHGISLGGKQYTLKGVVYFGEADLHFASRVIDDSGRVFRYDGMLNGGCVTFDSQLPNEPSTWMATMAHRVASIAVYTAQGQSTYARSDTLLVV